MTDKRARAGLRMKLIAVLTLATGLTLAILVLSYRKMLIEQAAFTTLSLAAVAAGAAGALAAYLLTRPILRDIESLADGARRLARGDLSTVVEVRTRGELAELAGAFNSMVTALRAQFEREREIDAARRRLVANVSHDLRTPVAAVGAMVQALRDDVVEGAEERQRYLRAVESDVRYMSRLLDDLSQLSELESGHVRLGKEETYIEDLLAEVLEGLHFAIDQKKLHLDVEILPGTPAVRLDPRRARQTLTNVLQNGIAHSPDRGVLTIRAGRAGDALELKVADEGPGIPKEQLSFVFERFYRGDLDRSRRLGGGMGLGLAIAREVMELHGGTIGVDEERESGTCIVMRFPLSA